MYKLSCNVYDKMNLQMLGLPVTESFLIVDVARPLFHARCVTAGADAKTFRDSAPPLSVGRVTECILTVNADYPWLVRFHNRKRTMAKKATTKKILQSSETINQSAAPPLDVNGDVGPTKSHNAEVAAVLDKEDVQAVVQALIDAFASEEPQLRPFLNLFGAASSNVHLPCYVKPGRSMKEQHQLIYSTFGLSTPNKTTVGIFSSLREYVMFVMDQYIFGTVPITDMEDSTVPNASQRKEAHLFLYHTTLCITAYFEGLVAKNRQSSTAHNPLLKDSSQIVLQLHNLIDTITPSALSSSKEVQMTHTAVVHLCELWWLYNGPDRENLIGNILPVLVGNVLHQDLSRATDLKRLWNLRSAFSIIDWEDPESQSCLMLLLRCTSSPTCVKSTDGKRFLSYLLSAKDLGNLPLQVHQSIRVQIPENKKSILLQYSDVYFGAWKHSMQSSEIDKDEELHPRELEMTILSDLVYASIYSLKPSLIQSVYIVLSKFYDQKHLADVASLLFRLYTPILWRAMAAPNPMVRMNAVSVLRHIFPLSSGNSSTGTTKVYTTLLQLLQDPDPRVRSTTSAVVSHILLVYWDGIPSQQIRLLLNRTYKTCSLTYFDFFNANYALTPLSYFMRFGPLQASSWNMRQMSHPLWCVLERLMQSPSCWIHRNHMPCYGKFCHPWEI
jgi:Condensin II non structural maintenance of chromosomes subunit